MVYISFRSVNGDFFLVAKGIDVAFICALNNGVAKELGNNYLAKIISFAEPSNDYLDINLLQQ